MVKKGLTAKYITFNFTVNGGYIFPFCLVRFLENNICVIPEILSLPSLNIGKKNQMVFYLSSKLNIPKNAFFFNRYIKRVTEISRNHGPCSGGIVSCLRALSETVQ